MRSTYANPIVAIIAAVVAVPVLFAAGTTSEELMEPRVSRYSGILPQSVCQELIKLGEETGFNVIEESIDDHQENPMPSQSIEVLSFEQGKPNEVINQPIWDALQPYLKAFADLVKKTRKEEHLQLYPDEPDREPVLDWIFFRKYAPTSDRNSLIPHVDTNVFTLNIALNDDFEGGGLFYVKPPMQDLPEDGRPDLKPEMTTYEWANTVKKENTSELVFPDMHAGDVLIHNFTVWHGVAPLDKGERYSFVLFYDMDNPIIADLDDSSTLPVEFYHEIEDVKVVLAFVEDFKDGTETLETIIDDFPPFEEQGLDSFEGHKFRAIVEDTGEVLADIVVSSEKNRYVIPKPASDPRDEL